MKWFRLYHEFVDDPKIAMMSDSDQLLWIKALCLASDSRVRGAILLSDEEICWKLRCTSETWKHAIDKFRAKGMIEHNLNGAGYVITNWDKRQFESDCSAERVRSYRAKRMSKPEQDPTAMDREVTVTTVKRLCNVTETPSDTDTDTNTDQESGTDAPPARPQPRDPSNRSTKRGRESAQQVYESLMDRSGFESFWVWYKKQICAIAGSSEGDKSKAGLAWRDLEQDNFRGIGRDGFRQACKTYKDRAIAAKGIGIPHAERFLSGGELREPRWLVLHLEHNVDGDPNFLDGVCDEDDLQDLSKAIGSELARLGWRGVIPDDWRNQSGIPAQVVSDLDARQAKAYLQYLRGQDARVEK